MREYYYEFSKSCSFNYKGAHMYVYSSLVKDSIVGNVFAPIIRVVGLEDKPKVKQSIGNSQCPITYL